MKKIAMVLFGMALVLPAIVFPAGASAAAAQENGAAFSEAEGKEWFLAEVKSSGGTIRMDRRKLAADNMGEVFSINFQKDREKNTNRASGMGAPNRYFAPYTAGGNKALKIENVASTMMAAFKEPDGLKESEFFAYLSKVTRWDLREMRLELYTSNANGREVVLIFTPR